MRGGLARSEHKGIPYHRKTLSFDAGDLKTAEYGALNPRHGVPVLVDDDFALVESAAIVEHIEEHWPSEPALFARDQRQRAIHRRMLREADDHLADLGQRLASGEGSEGRWTTHGKSLPYGRTPRPASI
jgi:glutathione S-transferase